MRLNDLESNSRQFAQEGASFARNKRFTMKSVMDKRRLVAEAIKASYIDAHFETIEQVFEESDLLTYEEGGRTWCTTPQVRNEERYFIKFAHEGHLMCEAFNDKPNLQSTKDLGDHTPRPESKTISLVLDQIREALDLGLKNVRAGRLGEGQREPCLSLVER